MPSRDHSQPFTVKGAFAEECQCPCVNCLNDAYFYDEEYSTDGACENCQLTHTYPNSLV